jgi:hypothetical protein
VSGNAIAKFCAKTLSATGEHEVWSGAAATMPQPDDGPLSLVSTSPQDAALVRDTWTIGTQDGTDLVFAIEVEGDESFACLANPDGSLAALVAAVNDGNSESYGAQITVVPDEADTAVLSIGDTDYTFTVDNDDADGVAAGLAALAAADPDYDVSAVGEGGYLAVIARLPNTAAPVVTIDCPDSGSAAAQKLVSYGPPSAVFTAASDGDDAVLQAIIAGTEYVVTADSDGVTVTHTATAGVGTGLHAVLVEYMDGDGLLQRRRVDLEGATPVLVADDEATALLDCYALAVGTGGGAAGTVTIADDDPTTIATIAVGASEIIRAEALPPEQGSPGTRNAFLLTGLQLSVAGAACTLRVRKTGPSGGGVLWQATVAAGGNEQWDLSDAPLSCEKSERLYLTIEGNGATATVGWTGYYTGEAA